MTNAEVHCLLCDTYGILDNASRSKAKQILRILSPVQQKCHYDSADSKDWVSRAKEIVYNLINQKNLVELFDKRQIKALYRILADYQIYPTCPLCGAPITKYSNNKLSNEFSWDHILPKSLGGSDDLYNLQPTHKGCNNDKGNDMLYHANYSIEIVVNIKFSMDMSKHHPKRNLPRKDCWRQKHNGRCR